MAGGLTLLATRRARPPSSDSSCCPNASLSPSRGTTTLWPATRMGPAWSMAAAMAAARAVAWFSGSSSMGGAGGGGAGASDLRGGRRGGRSGSQLPLPGDPPLEPWPVAWRRRPAVPRRGWLGRS
jgi:hypothetical protein